MLHLAEHVEELNSEDIAETFDMPDHLSQIECSSLSREASSGYIEDLLLLLPASVVGESQESVEPNTRACLFRWGQISNHLCFFRCHQFCYFTS